MLKFIFKTLILFILFLNFETALAQQSKCKVSSDQYIQVKSGLSYGDVKKILGCDGYEMSSSDFGGTESKMIIWTGKGEQGANMTVMFINNKVVSKAKAGF